jgi:hypothetical protein
MNESDLLLKIGPIFEKDDRYYFFKGVLSTFNAKNTCKLLDNQLKQDSFKRQLILDKILKDLIDLENRDLYLSVFKEMLVLIARTKDYRKNQGYAKFLYRMYPAMPILWQKKLIKYFISSDFKHNQRRALEYLDKNWDENFSSDVIKLWTNGNYELALKLIIWKVDKESLSADIFNSINTYFIKIQEDDYFNYDYSAKILRNKFYSRFIQECSKEVDKLKKNDPISYIFIQKEAGRKIDLDFAIKVYKNNSNARKYLPRWYSEMGMEDVLGVILTSL